LEKITIKLQHLDRQITQFYYCFVRRSSAGAARAVLVQSNDMKLKFNCQQIDCIRKTPRKWQISLKLCHLVVVALDSFGSQ